MVTAGSVAVLFSAFFEYIEGWYNRKRRHSALGYLTPCQYEGLLYNQAVAA
ncbi:hypothetical protein DXT99_24555 [Pontibacter diazotrophicus]|uniref:Integrase catalytic domain-containing protein n=1 Tax=Pontibacter diazotrophicus TaxID=1400979 RepID=A0A3D8L2B8_9BACT|nr:IS3 family transposase [Pontibacter diazotrophicus]RDV11506.1 hypothetical protein DXT99_24555 [Pontibacter diazotrophicus]